MTAFAQNIEIDLSASRRIRGEFEKGRHHYALHGKRLEVLPSAPESLPAREFLEWHNGIFKG